MTARLVASRGEANPAGNQSGAMSREVVMSIRRSPLGTCSLCLKPAETVVGCSARIDSPFYGFCLSCVERMARVARVAQPKRTPSKKKGT